MPSTPDFSHLVGSMLEAVDTLNRVINRLHLGNDVIAYHLEAHDDGLRYSGRRALPLPKNNPPLSAHDHLALKTAETALVGTMQALDAAIAGIKGLDPTWQDYHLKVTFRPSGAAGYLRLESAGVCPSGESWIKNTALAVQGALMADQLQRAWSTSHTWTQLTPWYVSDMTDAGTIGAIVREVYAPDAIQALEADGWTWWAIPPQEHHHRCVRNSVDGDILHATHKRFADVDWT